MDPTLSVDELSELKFSVKELVEVTRNRSVYFSNQVNDIPIVIDTGATMSVSPCKEDFIGGIEQSDTKDLQGLSGATDCLGQGLVQWTVRDVFGAICTRKTQAYYVLKATICLYSPQCYFQENDAGEFYCNSRHSVLMLADGSTLEFPYNQGSNLPLMLPDCNKSPMGLTFEDVTMLRADAPSIFLSVADESNQNMTASQKELLKWLSPGIRFFSLHHNTASYIDPKETPQHSSSPPPAILFLMASTDTQRDANPPCGSTASK